MQKLKMALIAAAVVGFSGAAVSGELNSEQGDPFEKWKKIQAEELGTLQGQGVVVAGDDNVVNEDSNNFTQTNDADNDQKNKDSPLIIDGANGGNATFSTGMIEGGVIAGNHGLVMVQQVSGNLNNVSAIVQFNIYFDN